ncbi:hypothetical protein J2S18_001023 [Eubacterium multiforme]|uniref:Uncharacterized protein n=2 Tax=Eubacterium multiforme TaxID=83339 RepID=A0ABT9UR18_9FIRM|nr:hypothetical protein [Eubacterium multiforme]MDQ0149093.1 hypothetical protein [Eubacterium multiforme]
MKRGVFLMKNIQKYIESAKEILTEKSLNILDGETVSEGTLLSTGIDELEEGEVLSFIAKESNKLNPVWYYYNIKNKVIYKHKNNKWKKIY